MSPWRDAGAHLESQQALGLWSSEQKSLHINNLELTTVAARRPATLSIDSLQQNCDGDDRQYNVDRLDPEPGRYPVTCPLLADSPTFQLDRQ